MAAPWKKNLKKNLWGAKNAFKYFQEPFFRKG